VLRELVSRQATVVKLQESAIVGRLKQYIDVTINGTIVRVIVVGICSILFISPLLVVEYAIESGRCKARVRVFD